MYILGNLLEVKTYKLMRKATLKHLASPRHSKGKRVHVAHATSLDLFRSAYDAESSVHSGTDHQQVSWVLLLGWERRSSELGILALRQHRT